MHTKEPPLKYIMAELDGKTTSNTVYPGPFWKIVDMVTNFRVRDSLQKLNVKKELIELRKVIIKSLPHN